MLKIGRKIYEKILLLIILTLGFITNVSADVSVKCFVLKDSLFRVCDDFYYNKYEERFKYIDFVSYINIANTCKFNTEQLRCDKNQLLQYLAYYISFALGRQVDYREPLDFIIDDINAFIYDYEYNVKVTTKKKTLS